MNNPGRLENETSLLGGWEAWRTLSQARGRQPAVWPAHSLPYVPPLETAAPLRKSLFKNTVVRYLDIQMIDCQSLETTKPRGESVERGVFSSLAQPDAFTRC